MKVGKNQLYTENLSPRTQRVSDVSCGGTYTPPKSTTPGRVQLSVGIEQKKNVGSGRRRRRRTPSTDGYPYPNTAGSRRIRDGYPPHAGACHPHRPGRLLSERVRTHLLLLITFIYIYC